jgi:hypothetical protein
MTVPTTHITLDPGWRIERYRRPLLYVLEVQDCTRYRWHEMYVASTLAEVEKAFVAYSEGETPESSEVWP